MPVLLSDSHMLRFINNFLFINTYHIFVIIDNLLWVIIITHPILTHITPHAKVYDYVLCCDAYHTHTHTLFLPFQIPFLFIHIFVIEKECRWWAGTILGWVLRKIYIFVYMYIYIYYLIRLFVRDMQQSF